MALQVSTVARYLLAFAQQKPESLVRKLRRAGLDIDAEAVAAYAELYGDYTTRMQERIRREVHPLVGQPDRQEVVHAEISAEWQTHSGFAFGRWLGLLRDQGHDVELLLSAYIGRPTWSASRSSVGDSFTMEELELEAERFGEGFERGFGSALETVADFE